MHSHYFNIPRIPVPDPYSTMKVTPEMLEEQPFQIARGTYANERMSGVAHQSGEYFDVPLITAAAPHTHPNLFQGGCYNGVSLADDFKTVVSLYPWEKYDIGPDTTRHEFTMFDSRDQELNLEEIDKIAQLVLDGLEKGKTLVHCQAGLNRSGLIAARALMLDGLSAEDAIDSLRKNRTHVVLCNPAFEQFLRSL